MILSKFHCPLQTKRYLTFFRLSGIIACIRGGCSSVVERQIVDLVVVGSNPITHPFASMFNYQTLIKKSDSLAGRKMRP